MKNPFSNETVKSATIVIGSAVAFIAISKGVSILRKKFGGNPKMQAIFGAQDKAEKRRVNECIDTCGCAQMRRSAESEASCYCADCGVTSGHRADCCESDCCESAG
jgi:hypothetical protein